MKELILRWLETTAEKNWFRIIDKQLRRIEKVEDDLWVQKCVLKELVDKYNKIYGTKLNFSTLTDLVDDTDN